MSFVTEACYGSFLSRSLILYVRRNGRVRNKWNAAPGGIGRKGGDKNEVHEEDGCFATQMECKVGGGGWDGGSRQAGIFASAWPSEQSEREGPY